MSSGVWLVTVAGVQWLPWPTVIIAGVLWNILVFMLAYLAGKGAK